MTNVYVEVRPLIHACHQIVPGNFSVKLKVLDTVQLSPPLVTFPHPNLESFFEVSLGLSD